MKTTTPHSKRLLESEGYLVDTVERWIPGANIRKDLWGMVDILAIRENEVLGVQVTSHTNVAARINKIMAHPNLPLVRKAGIRIEVHGWKNTKGKWTVRREDLS
jgi:carbonic anhydrase